MGVSGLNHSKIDGDDGELIGEKRNGPAFHKDMHADEGIQKAIMIKPQYCPILLGWPIRNPVLGSTRLSGAQVKFTFEGVEQDISCTFVEVYGATNSTALSMVIKYTLDNQTIESPHSVGHEGSISQLLFRPPSLLNRGLHNLTITVSTIPEDQTYILNYFMTYSDTAAASTQTSSNGHQTHKVDTGAIIGWSIAAVMALLAIVVFLLLRNHGPRHKQKPRQLDNIPYPTVTPTVEFLTNKNEKAYDLYQSPSKSKSELEPEASSVSLPPVPPPTPTTATLALGLDPGPLVLRPSLPTTGHIAPASIASGNSNGTALPCYTSRVGTLPPIPDLPPPPVYS
ncbi:hypothetical protein PM082_018552 [Marasmius tenuissimus]|nr:hypothetical protein PM082_018552 [Marasmius tenuissimus]